MTRPKRAYGVLGFSSTHRALDAESLLEREGVDVVPIPAPAALSAQCGIALRVPLGEVDKAIRCLDKGDLAPQSQANMDDY